MSQHYYSTTMKEGEPVLILAGWDEPLQSFFVDIELDISDEEKEKLPNDGYVYESMGDESITRGNRNDWSVLADKLSGFGVSLPEAMVDHLQLDRENKSMNKVFKSW